MNLTGLRPHQIPKHIKRSLIDYSRKHSCTLNGEPALVHGAKCDFAMVTANNNEAEFAWPTVERILKLKHGNFQS